MTKLKRWFASLTREFLLPCVVGAAVLGGGAILAGVPGCGGDPAATVAAAKGQVETARGDLSALKEAYEGQLAAALSSNDPEAAKKAQAGLELIAQLDSKAALAQQVLNGLVDPNTGQINLSNAGATIGQQVGGPWGVAIALGSTVLTGLLQEARVRRKARDAESIARAVQILQKNTAVAAEMDARSDALNLTLTPGAKRAVARVKAAASLAKMEAARKAA
jgi:hypothetical protein